MNSIVSSNTQATLLLTAPLITGRGGYTSELLPLGEYNRLAKMLRDKQREPADLLGPEVFDIMDEFRGVFDVGRLKRLLERGFLLTQALDKWQARSIWVISRADHEYPTRIKSRLKESAPPVLYGCGDSTILNTGGLAIVGSRKVDETLVEYTENIGRLAARSNHTVVSGGARGIDQSAMSGALQAGGKVIGVLAENLNRLVLSRDLREYLMNNQLVLISPYDPAAGFNVGNAMNRNKIIYALADAALIVSSDYKKGGTWTGAIEQLERLHIIPVYVRSDGEIGKGLRALQEKGALAWPNPQNSDAFIEALNIQTKLISDESGQELPPLFTDNETTRTEQLRPGSESITSLESDISSLKPADQLFAQVKDIILNMNMPKTETEVAAELQVSKSQAREWLQRLVKQGTLTKKLKPVRYFIQLERQENLFE
jgi:DNA processing protein